MIYKEFKPHVRLRRFIKCLWLLEREYDDLQPSENVFPDSYVEVIFNFGATYSIETSSGPRDLPANFMIGLLKQVLPLRASGKAMLLAARFYPWEVFTFLNIAAEPNVSANVVNIALNREQEDEVRNCFQSGDHETAVRIFERFLLEIYVKENYESEIVNAAAQTIYQK